MIVKRDYDCDVSAECEELQHPLKSFFVLSGRKWSRPYFLRSSVERTEAKSAINCPFQIVSRVASITSSYICVYMVGSERNPGQNKWINEKMNA